MLDAVARVAPAIGLLRGRVAIQRAADGAIADGMGGNLEAVLVGPRHQRIEFRGREERRPLVAGMARIVVDHQRGQRFQHAVDEDLHAVAVQHVAVVVRAHVHRLVDARQFEVVLLVEGDLDPRVELAAIQHLLQQFELIPVAVHVVHGGDAERGGIGDALLEEGDVGGALCRGRRRVGVLAGGHAQPLAPAGGGQRLHQHVGGGLAQFAGGDAFAVEHDLVAHRQVAAAHDAGCFQRLGIGPHGVMVEAADDEGDVGDDAVQQLPGNGLAEGLVDDARGQQNGVLGARLAVLRN